MKLRHLRMLIACNIVHRSMHRLFHIVLLVKQDPVSLYQTGWLMALALNGSMDALIITLHIWRLFRG